MITKKHAFTQLPKELEQAFSLLKIGYHLRKAGIVKGLGYSCLEVFRVIFLLIFEHKNWFRMLESKKKDLFGKDVVYRFLNNPCYAWRKFLLSLSLSAYEKIQSLTSAKRVKVFIVDDSTYNRSRSKSLELLAKVKDHTTGKFVKGFRMLTLGWSDGHSFIPVDFSLLSSTKTENRYQEINDKIDKRTSGFKRRQEAIQSGPTVISALLDHALQAGMEADYVLMDTWFTHAPLIETIHRKGLFVIGMIKELKQRYLHEGQYLTLSETVRFL
jgi:hypothetical protein